MGLQAEAAAPSVALSGAGRARSWQKGKTDGMVNMIATAATLTAFCIIVSGPGPLAPLFVCLRDSVPLSRANFDRRRPLTASRWLAAGEERVRSHHRLAQDRGQVKYCLLWRLSGLSVASSRVQ